MKTASQIKTEPCPFCGARMTPAIEPFGVKKCTICGKRWIDSGRFTAKNTQPSPPGGGGETPWLHA